MDYEKKFLIGDSVKGKRTFNGEIIEGKFNGFYLYNNLNPESVVGVIDTGDRCYDVCVGSIELKESDDEKIRKEIIHVFKGQTSFTSEECAKKYIAWLEKQGEHAKFRESIQVGDNVTRNEAGQLVNLSQLERIAKPREQKLSCSEEDEKMLKSCITILEQTNVARNEWPINEAEDDWLKSIKPRWKPSEQNIKDLEWCADLVKDKMGVGFHRLQVFIDELKNL